MAPSSPLVRFERVTKRFADTIAVDALELDIGAGQFVTLLGPSGCGKSTTLRMLGGFEQPDSGRILIDGEDVTRQPPHRRDVNMVFQDYALFPHMSVARNVAFGLEMKGHSKEAIDARVAELLALVQLESLGDRRPDQLSGGQRQRVALIRALAPDPKLLLLDEPLGALDAKLRTAMQIELKAMQQRTGKTFLFVTHDQEEALTMSDLIVVMNAGRIEQAGTPRELYHRPRSRFVAGFIGESNLLEATVEHCDGQVCQLAWQGAQLRANAPDAPPRPGDRIHVALRPEHILCSIEEPDLPNRLMARVTGQVFKGSRTVLTVVTEGGGRLDAHVDPALMEGRGDEPLWIGFDPARMIVLAD